MDDTLRFASRLCKFIVAASFLLVAVASLCLWWTGQAYEYAALAFFPFAVPADSTLTRTPIPRTSGQ
ncbi:hypothetical protein [Pseudomonas aeruginosa]|uniref:hypothetical protein n=1 Tax=Pseudomonas aeruginosa TaxID=287 RepID=UPI000EB5E8A0|nr:hypothetical protein [Pseudomonas aeruginosa]